MTASKARGAPAPLGQRLGYRAGRGVAGVDGADTAVGAGTAWQELLFGGAEHDLGVAQRDVGQLVARVPGGQCSASAAGEQALAEQRT